MCWFWPFCLLNFDFFFSLRGFGFMSLLGFFFFFFLSINSKQILMIFQPQKKKEVVTKTKKRKVENNSKEICDSQLGYNKDQAVFFH